jgi:hypothetical protein
MRNIHKARFVLGVLVVLELLLVGYGCIAALRANTGGVGAGGTDGWRQMGGRVLVIDLEDGTRCYRLEGYSDSFRCLRP